MGRVMYVNAGKQSRKIENQYMNLDEREAPEAALPSSSSTWHCRTGVSYPGLTGTELRIDAQGVKEQLETSHAGKAKKGAIDISG
jgi:hypothetical protein